ncbi:hypothetical protein QBC37DRAFT_412972 [Rhypophila decipiens]|uniref:Uncharacterized protein n=1 Tax=Rhypophila decipiens TaxID=261697 RepID=A0AAN6YGK1_9PEZI|nr:hypothetical protein QBC37DRAFT_412972 [Rhypophila decipiens]
MLTQLGGSNCLFPFLFFYFVSQRYHFFFLFHSWINFINLFHFIRVWWWLWFCFQFPCTVVEFTPLINKTSSSFIKEYKSILPTCMVPFSLLNPPHFWVHIHKRNNTLRVTLIIPCSFEIINTRGMELV